MSTAITAPASREASQPQRRRRPPSRRWTRFLLPAYSWLVIAYLVFPIAVMILYSFNKVSTGLPQVSFAWNGFTTQWYQQWSDIPQLTTAFWLSIRLALAATLLATIVGTLLALALVRYRPPRFRGKGLVEQVMFLNIAAPEIVLGASLLGLFVTINVARGFITLLLAHVAFSIAYVDDHRAGPDVGLRPVPGGGRAGPGRQRLGDVPQDHPAADHARRPGRRADGVRAVYR